MVWTSKLYIFSVKITINLYVRNCKKSFVNTELCVATNNASYNVKECRSVYIFEKVHQNLSIF